MKRILLIDDNQAIRENTAEILELEQYEVYTAHDGQMGVDIAIKEIPDLILCDIMMPVLDGFGVLLELNKNQATAGIPFIFLTSKAEVSDQLKGIRLGADDYITKPFDDRLLLSSVEAKIHKNEMAKKQRDFERMAYVRELENMLHLTSHRVRKPICTFLGLMQLIEMNSQMERPELNKILEESKKNALELDAFTHELTTFILEITEKKKSNNWE